MANKKTVNLQMQLSTEVDYKGVRDLKDYLEDLTSNYSFEDSIAKGLEKALSTATALEKTMKNTLKAGTKVSDDKIKEAKSNGKAVEELFNTIEGYVDKINSSGGFAQYAKSFIEAKNKIIKEINTKTEFKNAFDFDFEQIDISKLKQNIQQLKTELDNLKNSDLSAYIEDAYRNQDNLLTQVNKKLENLNHVKEEAKKIERETLMKYAPKGINTVEEFENKGKKLNRKSANTIYAEELGGKDLNKKITDLQKITEIMSKYKDLEEAKANGTKKEIQLLEKYEGKVTINLASLKEEIGLLKEKKEVLLQTAQNQLDNNKETHNAYKVANEKAIQESARYIKANSDGFKTVDEVKSEVKRLEVEAKNYEQHLTDSNYINDLATEQYNIDITNKENDLKAAEAIDNGVSEIVELMNRIPMEAASTTNEKIDSIGNITNKNAKNSDSIENKELGQINEIKNLSDLISKQQIEKE